MYNYMFLYVWERWTIDFLLDSIYHFWHQDPLARNEKYADTAILTSIPAYMYHPQFNRVLSWIFVSLKHLISRVDKNQQLITMVF